MKINDNDRNPHYIERYGSWSTSIVITINAIMIMMIMIIMIVTFVIKIMDNDNEWYSEDYGDNDMVIMLMTLILCFIYLITISFDSY